MTSWTDKIKNAMRSKVLWFNAVMLALIDQMPYIIGQIIDGLPSLQPYIGGGVYKHVMGFVLIVNFLFRFRTRRPVLEPHP